MAIQINLQRRVRGLLAGVWLPVAAIIPLSAQAAETPRDKPPAVEERADALLRHMGEFLSNTQRFALEAEETFDEIPDDSPRIALTNVRRVAVIRPNRFAADVSGDTLSRSSWYDGQNLSALDKAHNTYVTIPISGTIDTALEHMAQTYGFHLPLADLLFADPYGVLTQEVTYGRYLGIHLAAGVPCHHLVFSQPTIEWQIWIDAGERPLPRKLAITYVDEPGEPQYEATIRKWVLDPEFSDALFVFEAPEDARRVEPATILQHTLPEQGQKGGPQ